MDMFDAICDPDISEEFTVLRSKNGKFVAGGWQDEKDEIVFFGTITIASGKDTNQTPEADQVNAEITFVATEEIFLDRTDPYGVADIIVYQGENYKVIQSQNYGTRHFWLGKATRMKGA